MMERAADAWEHNQFKEVVVKVANVEIYYKVSQIITDIISDKWIFMTDIPFAGAQLLPPATAYPDN
jgi:hypothetical protein